CALPISALRLPARLSTDALACPASISPAFCRQAETKLAQLTLFGTQDSIGSSSLNLSSPALRPMNCSAIAAALLPLTFVPPDTPSVPDTPPDPSAPPPREPPPMFRVSPA